MTDDRTSRLRELDQTPQWDVLVIGGGASGLGAAVEAASRGYRTLLLRARRLRQGNISRSTKLVHGGVRYLEQLNITLVLDALRERGHMLRNAPHLVTISLRCPALSFFRFHTTALASKCTKAFRETFVWRIRILSRQRNLEPLPAVMQERLLGGILYHDGQFDDARYAISLCEPFKTLAAVAINYAQATAFSIRTKSTGVHARDCETAQDSISRPM